MSIQSTQDIPRENAIWRIRNTVTLLNQKNYREIEEMAYENNFNVQLFVDNWIPIDISNIDFWTDEMLANQMDCPFFRYSMFDNYQVVG